MTDSLDELLVRRALRDDVLSPETGTRLRTGLICSHERWQHALAWLLTSIGCDVSRTARRVADCASIGTSGVSLLVVDTSVDVEGLELLHALRSLAREGDPPAVVVTVGADGNPRVADYALAGGAAMVARRDDACAVVDAVVEAHAALRDGRLASRPRLTHKEFEVLRLLAGGRTNREVAAALWVTEQTVKYHLANIYRKLGVRGRAAALDWIAQIAPATVGSLAHRVDGWI